MAIFYDFLHEFSLFILATFLSSKGKKKRKVSLDQDVPTKKNKGNVSSVFCLLMHLQCCEKLFYTLVF